MLFLSVQRLYPATKMEKLAALDLIVSSAFRRKERGRAVGNLQLFTQGLPHIGAALRGNCGFRLSCKCMI